MADHVLVAEETTLGTFVTPGATATPVISWSPDPGQEQIEERQTGVGRNATTFHEGAYRASGSLEMYAVPEQLPYFIKAAGFPSVTTAQVAATTAYDHSFEQNDTAALDSLSIQLQQIRNGTTKATNLRGVVIGQLSISGSVDELVTVSMDYVAIEELYAGGTFADTNSSPAAVGSVTYPTAIEAHGFWGFAGTYAGTAAKASAIWTITSGTAFAGIESFELTINNNLDHRVFMGSRYPTAIHAGNREVTGSFVLDNDTPADVFYQKMLGNTKEPIQIQWTTDEEIEAGYNYELEFTFPRVLYTAMFGDISAENDARTKDISFSAMKDATEVDVIGIRVRDDYNTGW